MLLLLVPVALVAGLPAADLSSGVDDREREVARPFRAPAQQQVRIEQRIVIRIAPMSASRRLPAPAREEGWRERKVGKCVPMQNIARVGIENSERLLLRMRNGAIIRASLDKSCRARDFYSGFYVERSRDGRLCVERDMLLSRSGASCSLSRLRRLQPADD